MVFRRALEETILTALRRNPPTIQVIRGPRQVGKTTVAHAVADRWPDPTVYCAADLPLPPDSEWLVAQWGRARRIAARDQAPLLIIDEVQKVSGWSETLKRLWDEDRRSGARVRVLVLGSSALLLTRGTTESLAGRFFLHRCNHWTFAECRSAFGWDLDQWLFFGGYPGAAAFVDDENTWRRYVLDSLIETVLSRDILALHTVQKPALLRQLFMLASQHPAQVLSYNTMLGQLQDAGNTVTLAHYLELFETAFLATGLQKYSTSFAKQRRSSPKLVLWNNALVTAIGLRTFEQVKEDHSYFGRLVDNAVGAHLVSNLHGLPYAVHYWRDRNLEVDFVVTAADQVWAIEVKSGAPGRLTGLAEFCRRNPGARSITIGSGGTPVDEFLTADLTGWFRP